jgi:hypothetical protein
MLSVCGSKLRTIQAYFDGEQLVATFSPLHDFSRASDVTERMVVTLLRHAVGYPVGNTLTTKVSKKIEQLPFSVYKGRTIV